MEITSMKQSQMSETLLQLLHLRFRLLLLGSDSYVDISYQLSAPDCIRWLIAAAMIVIIVPANSQALCSHPVWDSCQSISSQCKAIPPSLMQSWGAAKCGKLRHHGAKGQSWLVYWSTREDQELLKLSFCLKSYARLPERFKDRLQSMCCLL